MSSSLLSKALAVPLSNVFLAEPTFVFQASATLSMCPAVGSKRHYKPAALRDPRILFQAALQF